METQTALFEPHEYFQKERPTQPSENQLAEFYSKMAKEIIEEGFSTSDEEDIIEDLKGLFPFNDNGFEMCKELDGYSANGSYECNTSFCEWLDSLSYELREINRQNVKLWVKENNPQPKFEIGNKLLIKEHLCYGFGKDKIVYVTSINESEAYYCIDEDPNKKGGTVLDYERVEKCCELA